MVKKLLLQTFLVFPFFCQASHLVGGEIIYQCLGNNLYQIELKVYRDCFSTGAQFDPNAVISIYNSSNTLVANLKPAIHSTSTLPINAPSNCSQLPNLVCTEVATYRTTVNLPPLAGGYTITHQRCCRNATINNIPNPEQWGATYHTTIPAMDNCNSSPYFNDTPPVVLCLNRPFELDMSATDNDGDSLYYRLCPVYKGGGQDQSNGGVNSPAPDPASPPPYTTVPFLNPYSASYPIASAPAISINPLSGKMKGVPNQLGQFSFAICVEEYRNGIRLNSIRRDFQFNVTDKCNSTISIIEEQEINPSTICNGRSMQFKSISLNTASYYWDFGDPGSQNDHSTLPNPSYTYSDTGTYQVMLVANPHDPCADTSYQEVKLYYPVEIDFEYAGEICFQNNLLDFIPDGKYSSKASFHWDFGGNTTLGRVYNSPDPPPLSYLEAGVYYVEVSIDDYDCRDSYGDTLQIFPYPELQHYCPQIMDCAPLSVAFSDSSSFYGRVEHYWDFGDGNSSTDPNPVHVYKEGGVYSVSHQIRTLQGCVDTLKETFMDFITVYPQPPSEITVYPANTSIYEPYVNLVNRRDTESSETVLHDGQTIYNLDSTTITFSDTGKYEILHITYNEYGCSDTSRQYITIDAPLQFFIPTAFTPNGDLRNDEFKMSITGIENFMIHIYNRWGELVFESGDLQRSWDGINKSSGTPAPPGVYTYHIKVDTKENSRTITRMGSVSLLR